MIEIEGDAPLGLELKKCVLIDFAVNLLSRHIFFARSKSCHEQMIFIFIQHVRSCLFDIVYHVDAIDSTFFIRASEIDGGF